MNTPDLLRAAALAMAAFATPLRAQEAPSHVYAGATAGRSHWSPGCADSGNCDNRGNVLRIFGGYQMNAMFAAEVAFANLGIIENSTSRLKAHAWEAVGVASWPANAKLSFYGKLGWFYGKVEGSGALAATHETSNGPTAAGGLQIELMRNVDLRGELQHYWSIVDGNTVPQSSGITSMTIGALWRLR